MPLGIFDAVGLLIFLVITAFIYKKGWFFSFYSFVKFLAILILSMGLALYLAGKNQANLPLTNLQLSLLLQGLSFAILWRLISFRRIFFKTTDGILGINRFIFVHKIDKVLNVIPSSVASFFIVFFLLTVAVSSSTSNPGLQKTIEDSKIVKPALYSIYFASFSPDNFGLFQNVAYITVPPLTSDAPNLEEIKKSAIESFKDKVNRERNKIGLAPLIFFLVPNISGPNAFVEATPVPSNDPNVSTYTPPTQTPEQPTPVPTSFQPRSVFVVLRTPTPDPNTQSGIPTPTQTQIQFFTNPTPTSIVYSITATPTMTPAPFIPQPTATPYPTPTPVPIYVPPPVNISQAEQDIFRLTNEERAKNGLPAFSWSDSIASVARAHSQDMVDRNFFSHVNPDGLDPFARMRAGGISYSAAAENIAGASTPEIIVENWMRSPGHRANILNPRYGKLGVGVAQSSRYGLVATQNFTD